MGVAKVDFVTERQNPCTQAARDFLRGSDAIDRIMILGAKDKG